jgi:hypothetical protein
VEKTRKELYDVYSSPNIIRVTISRRMRWAGHVARMRGEVYTGFWWGNLRERDHLEGPGVDGRKVQMDLQEVGCWGTDWIDMAQDRDRWRALVNAVMYLRVP